MNQNRQIFGFIFFNKEYLSSDRVWDGGSCVKIWILGLRVLVKGCIVDFGVERVQGMVEFIFKWIILVWRKSNEIFIVEFYNQGFFVFFLDCLDFKILK